MPGYVTDIITDMSLDWLNELDRERPFMLMCHHKAPHRPWEPDEKHAHLFLNEAVPEPRHAAGRLQRARRGRGRSRDARRVHMRHSDIKAEIAHDLPEAELRSWAYQRYIKDYLRVVASIDDNVGRLLDWLDEQGLAEDTVVVYTSDQGFFLGDHGWYDKRFMYEESLRMPLLVRYPRAIEAGSRNADMVLNVDFAPTFLELGRHRPRRGHAGPQLSLPAAGRYAGGLARGDVLPLLDAQGAAQRLRPLRHPARRHKLIYYYADALGQAGSIDESHEPEWELFDLQEDPAELHNLIARRKWPT